MATHSAKRVGEIWSAMPNRFLGGQHSGESMAVGVREVCVKHYCISELPCFPGLSMIVYAKLLAQDLALLCA